MISNANYPALFWFTAGADDVVIDAAGVSVVVSMVQKWLFLVKINHLARATPDLKNG